MIAASKRTIASTSESRYYSRGKGKRSCNEPNEDMPEVGTPELGESHIKGGDPNDRPNENSKQESKAEGVRFTISSAWLLGLIQSLPGFEWTRPLRGDLETRDKSRFYEYHKDVKHRTNECFQLWRLLRPCLVHENF